MEGNTVYWAEVIAHACKLLFEYQMEKSCIELAGFGNGRVDGLLTTAKQDMIPTWRYGCRIDWLLSTILFELLERLHVNKFRRVVL